MNTILKYSLIAFSFMTIISCKTISHTYRTADIKQSKIIANDVIVDVDVDFNKRVTGHSEKYKTSKEAKNEAYYKAITQNNIDIIVDPIYEIKRSYGKFTASVTGYAGFFKNTRSKIDVINELKDISLDDIKKYDLLFGGKIIRTEKKTIAVIPNKKPDTIHVKSLNGKKKITNKRVEKFQSYRNYGIKMTNSSNTITIDTFDDVISIENNGIAFGVFSHRQFKEKWGARVEMLYAANSISNNLHIPFLFSYGKRFKVLFGTDFTFSFKPKDDSGYNETYFRDNISGGLSLGGDFGFSFDITKKLSISSQASYGVDAILGNTNTQAYAGLSYSF